MKMQNKPMTIIRNILIAAGISAFLASCGNNTGMDTPISPAGQTARVMKIGLMLDKSGSAESTRTKQPSLEDIQPLIERIKQSGGELAVGLISDNSNMPLVRLRIDLRPAAPTRPDSNEYSAEKLAAAYDKYDVDTKAYKTKFAAWEVETSRRVERFTADVAKLFQQKPNSRRTDVMNALNRVDLFLSEKDPFPADTARVIILNSDAQDNVKAKLMPLTSEARLIVVNGIGSVGSLKALNPELFESLESAIDQITRGE
ncbi:MAG: hypothetical protein KF881_01535 [Acidobacteria bacterium]|nr:hypothetical protein [Acidobacteriota bacterium]